MERIEKERRKDKAKATTTGHTHTHTQREEEEERKRDLFAANRKTPYLTFVWDVTITFSSIVLNEQCKVFLPSEIHLRWRFCVKSMMELLLIPVSIHTVGVTDLDGN